MIKQDDNPLPYVTSGIPALPGTIKARYEDFEVDEIPAYQPCGEGSHVYFTIEKRGLATPRAVGDIARALGVKRRDIGLAGMKDARAVTRQMLSLENADEDQVRALSIPRIKVLKVSRHRNKLKIGHTRGNSFKIRLRDTDPSRIEDVRGALHMLCAKGVPNYFGPQRFGNRGDTWQVGRFLLRGDFEKAASIIAGSPGPRDSGKVLEARELFEAGRYEESRTAWPRGYNESSTLCSGMIRFSGNHEKAVLAMDRRTLGLYVSAYQSHLFNKVVAARIDRLDRIEEGDLAWKHDSGAVFKVEDAAREQPRADRFEISATGPIFGVRMKQPGGPAAELENAVFSEEGLRLSTLSRSGPLRCNGARRSLRFRPEHTSVSPGEDEHGAYLEIVFALPSGSYATSLLREICKELMVSKEGLE